MKLFLVSCLMSIVVVVVMYILALCDNYNFMSFILGMIIGGVSGILGCSTKD